jgi:hypothetical protein
MHETGTTQEITPTARIEGFLVGAVVGVALAAESPAPSGARHAATALADGLLEELLGSGVDLHRLAGRWLSWWEHDGFGADPQLADALNHLRDFDAPRLIAAVPGLAAISAVLPASLAGASPQSMVAGAFHVAGMLDPNEAVSLAAASVVLTGARFLEGRRDFIADVIGMLRANDAPEVLLEPIRAIPRDPRSPPPLSADTSLDPMAAVTWLLWTVHHRPRGAEILPSILPGKHLDPHLAAALGALLGARDGMDAWPSQWGQQGGEGVVLRRAIARRLANS